MDIKNYRVRVISIGSLSIYQISMHSLNAYGLVSLHVWGINIDELKKDILGSNHLSCRARILASIDLVSKGFYFLQSNHSYEDISYEKTNSRISSTYAPGMIAFIVLFSQIDIISFHGRKFREEFQNVYG